MRLLSKSFCNENESIIEAADETELDVHQPTGKADEEKLSKSFVIRRGNGAYDSRSIDGSRRRQAHLNVCSKPGFLKSFEKNRILNWTNEFRSDSNTNLES